ncbi:hypothetical protein [Sutcliffiella rhizosphaerae]|uniref:Uncharacterized protein n=1 Tax=Sutcliffiella rhizosphaerae TaxID=2880967 RepID=A0ABM8YMR2_9BACI|nr:hypothetical protein [Sutcliffiella rhizosphaerae]CAG9621140.1 hypothetical protein BACCIP111883_01912 [Sutcliffiella rhizosphaerae]
MKREVRLTEKLLLAGFSFILIFMIVQDWVPLGSLNDVYAIAEDRTTGELITVTLVGFVQFLILTGVVLYFLGRRYPFLIKLWLIIHQMFIFVGALFAWWIPYFFGYGAAERVERYDQMFGNTHSFLPPMNGIVPNTLHTIFHFILFICILLTIYISITDSRKKKSTVVSLDR